MMILIMGSAGHIVPIGVFERALPCRNAAFVQIPPSVEDSTHVIVFCLSDTAILLVHRHFGIFHILVIGVKVLDFPRLGVMSLGIETPLKPVAAPN